MDSKKKILIFLSLVFLAFAFISNYVKANPIDDFFSWLGSLSQSQNNATTGQIFPGVVSQSSKCTPCSDGDPTHTCDKWGRISNPNGYDVCIKSCGYAAAVAGATPNCRASYDFCFFHGESSVTTYDCSNCCLAKATIASDPCVDANGKPKSDWTYECQVNHDNTGVNQNGLAGGWFDCKDTSGKSQNARQCKSPDICQGSVKGAWPCFVPGSGNAVVHVSVQGAGSVQIYKNNLQTPVGNPITSSSGTVDYYFTKNVDTIYATATDSGGSTFQKWCGGDLSTCSLTSTARQFSAQITGDSGNLQAIFTTGTPSGCPNPYKTTGPDDYGVQLCRTDPATKCSWSGTDSVTTSRAETGNSLSVTFKSSRATAVNIFVLSGRIIGAPSGDYGYGIGSPADGSSGKDICSGNCDPKALTSYCTNVKNQLLLSNSETPISTTSQARALAPLPLDGGSATIQVVPTQGSAQIRILYQFYYDTYTGNPATDGSSSCNRDVGSLCGKGCDVNVYQGCTASETVSNSVICIRTGSTTAITGYSCWHYAWEIYTSSNPTAVGWRECDITSQGASNACTGVGLTTTSTSSTTSSTTTLSQGGQCRTNIDCPINQYCINGLCMPINQIQCNFNSDCPQPAICLNHICQPVASTTSTSTTTTTPPVIQPLVITCPQCSANSPCTCSIPSNSCNNGAWLITNLNSNPLPQINITTIPPYTVYFYPNQTGTVNATANCFDAFPNNRTNATTVTVQNSFLTCPSSCVVNSQCSCTVNGCSSGLFLATFNNAAISTQPFSSNPYTATFTPTQTGTVTAVSTCNNPLLPSVNATIQIVTGSTVSPPPGSGGFSHSNFKCVQTGSRWICTINYNNQLSPAQTAFLFFDASLQGVVKQSSKSIPISTGTGVSSPYTFDCGTLGTGSYAVTFKVYQTETRIGPVDWAKVREQQTITCT